MLLSLSITTCRAHASTIGPRLAMYHSSPFSTTAFRATRWTEEERNIVRQGVLEQKTIHQITSELPDRNFSAVSNMFSKVRGELGLSYRLNKWSDIELSTLRQARLSGASLSKMRAALPGRPKVLILSRLSRLKREETGRHNGLKPTEAEIIEIVKLRDVSGQSFVRIAEHFGRSKTAIINAYRNHKPWSSSMPGAPYTDSENSRLLCLRDSGLALSEVAARLERSLHSVQTHLARLYDTGEATPRRAFWSEEEIEILRKYRNEGMTIAEISKRMPGRSAQSVQAARSNYGFSGTGENDVRRKFYDRATAAFNPWTAEELHTMKALRTEGLCCKEIASRLPNRTVSAVYKKAYRLSTELHNNTPDHTSDEANISATPVNRTQFGSKLE